LRIIVAVFAMGNMPDKFATGQIGLKAVAIGLGKPPEHIRPVGALPQAIGIVDGVSRFVAQEHHQELVVFHFAGLLLLDLA